VTPPSLLSLVAAKAGTHTPKGAVRVKKRATPCLRRNVSLRLWGPGFRRGDVAEESTNTKPAVIRDGGFRCQRVNKFNRSPQRASYATALRS
jgi:hypothetical protein